jgi:hypothetical protein
VRGELPHDSRTAGDLAAAGLGDALFAGGTGLVVLGVLVDAPEPKSVV